MDDEEVGICDLLRYSEESPTPTTRDTITVPDGRGFLLFERDNQNCAAAAVDQQLEHPVAESRILPGKKDHHCDDSASH